MEIKGAIIRSARLRKHLSQANLAAGICTQGTISLLEKHDQCVSMDILYAVCLRLNIQPQEVICQSTVLTPQRLQDALILFMQEDVDGCAQILSTIRTGAGMTATIRRQYFTLSGLVALAQQHNLTSAISLFGQAVNEEQVGEWDIFRLLAQLGYGCAHFRKNAMTQADYYIRSARMSIEERPQLHHPYGLESNLLLLLAEGELALAQWNYERAAMLVHEGLAKLRANGKLFIIDRFLFLFAQISHAMGQKQETAHYLDGTLWLATLREHDDMKRRISAKVKEWQMSICYHFHQEEGSQFPG
ncbi:MAG: helix-turn-helix transcriptional regulator [Schleiferilactobacillus perolens]|uniref:helix-turn-helix domain-containing protein n=1 Tax=Schleiferilactobacillus perolens TaxID=100468 RepID=UPI0039E927C1